VANQNRVTADGPPGAPGPATASFSAGARLPAPEAITRIMLRPLASSLPLGFFAFGTGSILLTALELHWVPAAQAPEVMVLVLAFVVPLELLAGVFAFLARDSGAATALALLGTAWAGVSVTTLTGPPGGRSQALSVFLLTLAPIMLLLSVAALKAKPLFGVLLAIGAVRFALTGVYQAGGAAAWQSVAGWIGVPLAAFALYGGLALLLEDSASQTVLPLGRRGRARTSLEGDFGHQIEHAEREPGVRRQL
jgi:succinate-acetate transporter protein